MTDKTGKKSGMTEGTYVAEEQVQEHMSAGSGGQSEVEVEGGKISTPLHCC